MNFPKINFRFMFARTPSAASAIADLEKARSRLRTVAEQNDNASRLMRERVNELRQSAFEAEQEACKARRIENNIGNLVG